ncbi:MAG: glutamate-5-semialdehyde dehydrogenase [Deltaproteobacteria bacterium]|nr:glutamate-5-semialdehyde dehydrogenase [Deltaproteobacteria bacterium]
MSVAEDVIRIAREAKEASIGVARLSTEAKNRAVLDMADALIAQRLRLQEENVRDIVAARDKGLSAALVDRLTLSDAVIEEMASALREVSTLPDPVGEVTGMWRRPNGLMVGRMRIPLGVIGIIYESRPNVTVDAAGLCLKSGNAVVLRGGSEALNSNRAIVSILQEAIAKNGIPPHAVSFIPLADREAVYAMLQLEELIDVIIPRGGEELIRSVVEKSKIPVIKHYKGTCHIFVDKTAETEMSERIVINAKCQRPGVCNALETLLVHQKIAAEFLPVLIPRLQEKGVEIRGCPRTCTIVSGIGHASEDDWYAEYLDLILAVKVVDGIEEAIKHIETYGSLHTESIITQSYENAQKFLREVGSSTVLVNASTRFSDGNQLGLGSEIGISTTKLHAFGPMGLKELTTTKFIVYGDGQIRE